MNEKEKKTTLFFIVSGFVRKQQKEILHDKRK